MSFGDELGWGSAKDEAQTIYEASEIDLGFPYSLYANESARPIAYGGMRDQILAQVQGSFRQATSFI
jgi:hypothetical protein